MAKSENEYLLRFEVRFRKMAPVKKLGILSVSDLLCPNKYKALSTMLINYFERISLLEPTLNMEKVTKSHERDLLQRAYDAQFWNDLKPDMSKQGVSQKKDKYHRLVRRLSEKNLKSDTLKLIRKKLTTLCNG